jgi:hypothetical protein
METIKRVFRVNIIQVWLLGILLSASFIAGLYARPGFDLMSELVMGVVSPKPVLPVVVKSDFEKAVDEYFESEQHQARCRAMATEQIAVNWAGKYLDIAKKEGERVRAYEIKAVNQISEKTAKETVRIEKEAGRGK